MNKKRYKQYLSSFPVKLKWPLLMISTAFLLGLIGYFVILFGGKLVIDDEKLVLDATTTIETVEGRTIGKLYHENRSPISLDQVPQYVRDAFVAIEDVRFYNHAGVDFKSVVRAVYRDIIAL